MTFVKNFATNSTITIIIPSNKHRARMKLKPDQLIGPQNVSYYEP